MLPLRGVGSGVRTSLCKIAVERMVLPLIIPLQTSIGETQVLYLQSQKNGDLSPISQVCPYVLMDDPKVGFVIEKVCAEGRALASSNLV